MSDLTLGGLPNTSETDVDWLLGEARLLEMIAGTLKREGQHKARHFMLGQATRLRRIAEKLLRNA